MATSCPHPHHIIYTTFHHHAHRVAQLSRVLWQARPPPREHSQDQYYDDQYEDGSGGYYPPPGARQQQPPVGAVSLVRMSSSVCVCRSRALRCLDVWERAPIRDGGVRVMVYLATALRRGEIDRKAGRREERERERRVGNRHLKRSTLATT